ncbi:MAG TPA: heparan-alpha-glucosaminide N-acetyltransferase [Roseiarcus sp.]|nr:heparan-alpha-glucosaminide N-acetyltransferase [Roseiarcus sp.]
MIDHAGGAESASRSRRIDAIDCARGLALVGMAIYHLGWDLADFRLAPPWLPFTPGMRLFSHIVASAFLALVGVSLALAHRKGFNRRAFWRRLAIVAGAAVLVSAGSYVFAPSEPITFGILHCIAVASLIAGPFVNAPASASLAVGVAAIAAPWLGRSALFDPPWLLWLGLGQALPNTLDWRPLMPWAGIVFLGLGVARLPGVLAWMTSPDRWRAGSAPWRAISLAGRHSLAVYLIHQPILIGLLWVLTAFGPLAPKADMTGFLASCQQACVARGRPAAECETGCRCVADAVVSSGDADRLESLAPERREALRGLADACMGR